MTEGRWTKTFTVGWAALDANGHFGNSSYLDLASDARMAFFTEHGVSFGDLRRLAIGPVIRSDELEYFREVGLHDAVTITCVLRGLSPDGARFLIENEMWLASGERSAVVRSSGGWLDLRTRKLVLPPPELMAIMQAMPRADDFVEMAPMRSRPARGEGSSKPG